ncbi:hypothetical protein GJ744_011552 [Endocarpon pusillum]|uniref:CCAAT-binding factor domain-containing protein n=1 Tax=Endocarpon pusillum TaxID=364733 RepID=A0A8H7E2T9_9EURO|nr:hypothetical protein GJ744_011552 [Endocarpon pusillum]
MSRPHIGKKRKWDDAPSQSQGRKRRTIRSGESSSLDIEQLEKRIAKDPSNNHNDVETLLQMLDLANPDAKLNLRTGIALCKVFSRLIASGHLNKDNHGNNQSQELSAWYVEQYRKYRTTLARLLRSVSAAQRLPLVHLCWKVLEQDAEFLGNKVWVSESMFKPFLSAVVDIPGGTDVRETYVDEYMNQCHDCCYHSLEYFSTHVATSEDGKVLENVIEILSLLDPPPTSTEDLNFLAEPPTKGSKKPLITPASLRRRAEEAWLSVIRSPHLTTGLRKSLLRITTAKILPWMSRPETLMDFLTDSYDVGGSTSLLALSGLFHLITAKNLDYPSFFPKLYSLIDADLLHSKHRSRFLRLLNTFLSSTRLPATLIASFIKRLSRRALFAPPAAIVAIIPYIYNLLKSHPTTTFMIHRPPHPPYAKSTENLGEDPFDMSQPDPQKTGAIDSSLWELETLQSHYHPNVASLARIISEQFTKQQYNIEDFLDHGYGSMLDSELAKEAKKEPVVEWRIPKRIFTRAEVDEEGQEGEGNLITRLWDFG